MNNKPVFAIARQYGSGGKTIGQMLANELNINCYEREILQMASEDSGINEALFANADEKITTNSFFKFKKIYRGQLISPESDGFVSNDNLFNYQAKVIKELAKKDSCVMIGRCANFILKDNPNLVSVFVYADEDFLLKSALERNTFSPKEATAYIDQTNKYRSEYYHHYTGQSWYDLKQYDLCLDSSKLGFEKCVQVIKAYADIRFSDQ
ncbi:MAG: cytidylate kinase-like family protein [Clostridia bacterium]|nr:cytidylate kinase-like family protein [Clostridia bacterium]